MFKEDFDVTIIGGGAAGLSAAAATAAAGLKTAVIDREEYPGGILLQCIHNGFGLHRYKTELTGPEYAEKVFLEAQKAGCTFFPSSTVTAIGKMTNGKRRVTAYSVRHGVMELNSSAVILAMGCRERNRGNIATPGSRPAGIFTAGLAQRLLNVDGCLPGKTAVIIGSGDIGLIMARRLSWVGIKVKAVIEIQPYPSGLPRNIAQCLEDFDIPLFLGHSVVRIDGNDRVSGVQVAPLTDGQPDLNKAFAIDCDTVLLSVGLVPENELSRQVGIQLDPATNGPIVDHNHMTSEPGIFACGNVLHVHDLVDYVSEESDACGNAVINYLRRRNTPAQGKIIAGTYLRYVTPRSFAPGRRNLYYMRAQTVMDKADLIGAVDGREVFRQRLNQVKPAEMIRIELPPETLAGNAGKTLELSLHPETVR